MAFSIFQLQKSKSGIHFKKSLRGLITNKTIKRWNSKYFITTPIFYVNAEPHIGHLYTAVIGDATARFQKIKNPDLEARFMVGTDEHGLKVIHSAKANDMEVKAFCDKVSNRYREMFEFFDIGYDDFVRTTEERHVKAATALWNKIFSKDLIYSDTYSGWYSLADEMFVSKHELDPNPGEDDKRYTLEDHKEVFFMEEVNYKFKLQNFKNDLLNWLKGDVIQPQCFQLEIIKEIEEERVLSNISVSRPTERVPWGIPVPGDPSQNLYVWFDALSSYLCTNGYPDSTFNWPPDVQIVGKDILKFHAIFWPAFLIAADLEPPRSIFCHSHWLKDNTKMSKSKGNVVDPFKSGEQFTSDGLRFFLLRTGVPQHDGNFSESSIAVCLNAELCDTLGNLLLRSTGKKVNPNQVFPALFKDYRKYTDNCSDELMKALEDLPEKVTTHFEEFNFYKGLDDIMFVLRLLNKFFQMRTPWAAENSGDHAKLTVHLTMEGLRGCGILLQPVTPKISMILLDKLSVPKNRRSVRDIRPFSWELEEEHLSRDLQIGAVRLFQKLAES